ncbi:MAG: TetR/AcrR family transcriptional regulator [Rhodococcus sp. (in: high G+C Gram-positive bacteria)]
MARSRATDNETLLRAAAEVFESKGYSNATIDDIAEAAGISRPTVYKYTSSKRSLLDDMVNMVCADLDERLHLVVCSDAAPTVRLRRLIDLHVESATKMKQFYSIVFSEQAELSEHAEVRWSEFTHAVATDFQKLLGECITLRASGAPLIDTHIAANLVLTMLTTLYRWYDADGPVGPAELTRQILAVLAGVVPASSVDAVDQDRDG